MAEPTVEEVVRKFVETRDEIKKQTDALEKKLERLKDLQTKREAYLNKKLSESGAQTIKTPAGTAFFKTQEFVSVAEWETFVEKMVYGPVVEKIATGTILNNKEFVHDIIKSSFPLELLTRAVNKTAILELMGENRDKPVPDGLNYVSKRVVQVRR